MSKRRSNRIVAAAAAGLVVASSSGRAEQLQLWSLPVGAVVTENDTGKTYRTPVTVNYTPGNVKDRNSNGCLIVKGYTATWQSGAKSSSPQVLQLCGVGPIWNYKFERPAEAPGLSIDVEVQNQIANNRRANELGKAMISGFLSGFAGNGRRYNVPPPIEASGGRASSSTTIYSSPQLAPDGSFVSGGRPVTLCPNGQYVAGDCVLTPNGTFVGQ